MVKQSITLTEGQYTEFENYATYKLNSDALVINYNKLTKDLHYKPKGSFSFSGKATVGNPDKNNDEIEFNSLDNIVRIVIDCGNDTERKIYYSRKIVC